MKIVKMSELEEGMIVARNISNSAGKIILKSGIKLDIHMINRLKKQNLEKIYIIGEDGEFQDDFIVINKNITLNKLKDQFLEHKDNKIMNIVFESIRDFILKN